MFGWGGRERERCAREVWISSGCGRMWKWRGVGEYGSGVVWASLGKNALTRPSIGARGRSNLSGVRLLPTFELNKFTGTFRLGNWEIGVLGVK